MSVRGWVYVITNKAMPDLVKVGYSTKDPMLRAKELDGTGIPHAFEVVYDALVLGPREVEQKAHKVLVGFREGKEWFRCSVDVAVRAIRQSAEKIYQETPHSDKSSLNIAFTSTKSASTSCTKCREAFITTLTRYESAAYCPRCYTLNRFSIQW